MTLDIWRIQSVAGFTLLTLFFGYKILKKSNLNTALLFLYCSVSAIFLFQTNFNVYGALHPRIEASSANSFLRLIMLAALMLMTPKNKNDNLIRIVKTLSLIESILVLTFGYGFMNAGSMSVTAIAITYPLMWVAKNKNKTLNFIYYVTPIASIISLGGTTAYACLFASSLVWGLYRRSIKEKLITLACTLIIPLTGALLIGKDVLESYDRFQVWQIFMNWFHANANIWTGTGTGTFEWIGPAILDRTKGVYLFMHNEYLQVLFEQGVIGFALMILVMIQCVHLARKRPAILASIAALSVAMLTQFPFRFFFTQFVAVLLIKLSFDERSNARTSLENP